MRLKLTTFLFLMITLNGLSNGDSLYKKKPAHGIGSEISWTEIKWDKLNYGLNYSLRYKQFRISLGPVFGNTFTHLVPYDYYGKNKGLRLQGGRFTFAQSLNTSNSKFKFILFLNTTVIQKKLIKEYEYVYGTQYLPESTEKLTMINFNIGFGLRFELMRNLFLSPTIGLGNLWTYSETVFTVPNGKVTKKESSQGAGSINFSINYFFIKNRK